MTYPTRVEAVAPPGRKAAAATFALGSAPAPAEPYLLWDQITGGFGDPLSAQNFQPALDAYDTEAADDFSVPGPGETFTLTAVDVGVDYSSVPASTLNVRFYNDIGGTDSASGRPADTPAISRLGIVPALAPRPYTNDPDIIYHLTLDPPVQVTSGLWWLSVQGNLDDQDPPGANSWYWDSEHDFTNDGTPATLAGHAYWRNPGDGFGTRCTDWTAVPDCAALQPGTFDGLSFQLETNLTAGPPTPPRPRPHPIGPPPNLTMPSVKVARLGPQSVRRRYIRVGLTLSGGGPVNVWGSGTLNVPGASRLYRLGRSFAVVQGDATTVARLKIGRNARRAASRALRRGVRLYAHVTIRLTNGGWRTRVIQRPIRLRR